MAGLTANGQNKAHPSFPCSLLRAELRKSSLHFIKLSFLRASKNVQFFLSLCLSISVNDPWWVHSSCCRRTFWLTNCYLFGVWWLPWEMKASFHLIPNWAEFWKTSQEACKMGSSVHNSLVVGTEGLRKKFQDKPIFALCPINFPIGNFYQEGRGTMLLYKYFCQYYLTWLVLSLLQESSSFSSVLYLLSNLSNVGLSKWIRRDLKS